MPSSSKRSNNISRDLIKSVVDFIEELTKRRKTRGYKCQLASFFLKVVH